MTTESLKRGTRGGKYLLIFTTDKGTVERMILAVVCLSDTNIFGIVKILLPIISQHKSLNIDYLMKINPYDPETPTTTKTVYCIS